MTATDPRTVLAVRVTPGGLATIDDIATAAGVNRSDVVRQILADSLSTPTARAALTRRLELHRR